MSYNDYYSHASTSSRANGHMPRQQPDRPIRFVPDVERGADQAERIRGGCCVCWGGSVWVCGLPDTYDDKDVRDARVSPISPTAMSFSSSPPSQASPPSSQPQSRRATAEDPGEQPIGPIPTGLLEPASKSGRVSFSPSPPHLPNSQSRPHRRAHRRPSAQSGVSEPTAVDSAAQSVSDGTAVGSVHSIDSPKAPRALALWQRLRDRILRPRGSSEAGGQQQQSTQDDHRHSINFGWYELNVEWD